MSNDPLYDKAPAWTKEQYELMQQHAIELGYYLITPYRKGLKNIKVGVIKPKAKGEKTNEQH